MIDSVIDYTELFLTGVKEVVKSDKEQPKFIKNNKRRALGHGEQSIWILKNLEW